MQHISAEGIDVKALRAFRVLRPLRLVSGVPSKFADFLDSFFNYSLLPVIIFEIVIFHFLSFYRFQFFYLIVISLKRKLKKNI